MNIEDVEQAYDDIYRALKDLKALLAKTNDAEIFNFATSEGVIPTATKEQIAKNEIPTPHMINIVGVGKALVDLVKKTLIYFETITVDED